jgi:hypothetical protein
MVGASGAVRRKATMYIPLLSDIGLPDRYTLNYYVI